jgi:hypothetical protein
MRMFQAITADINVDALRLAARSESVKVGGKVKYSPPPLDCRLNFRFYFHLIGKSAPAFSGSILNPTREKAYESTESRPAAMSAGSGSIT